MTAVADILTALIRHDRGRLLAALVSRTGDFQRAEDALQEAAASALVHWGRAGVPHSPQGWLLKTGLRKAIDGFRREGTASRHATQSLLLAQEEASDPDPGLIPDERLRLIFTCCHPALEEKSRLALTLRSLCGLSTAEVAAVFLDAEPTMGQRLSRARAKIAGARIPFVVPGPEDWPARLNSVLTVIYLVFTCGYATGPVAGRDLCDEAVFLARMVNSLTPEQAEVEGTLALLLLTHARVKARVSAAGETVPSGRQDRSLWNLAAIAEGRKLLSRAMARHAPGQFQIKAAIADCHLQTPPDWPQIAALFGGLLAHEDTPVIRLNHAVALAETLGPSRGLMAIDDLKDLLGEYQPFHAARAEYLARTGQVVAACAAFERAIALTEDPADRAYLSRRRDALLPPEQAV